MKTGDTQPKSVLITGATDGLGKALALLLAERGYRVFAAGRSAEKLAQLDALAREKKFALESIALDVCSDASVQSAIQTVLGKTGAIDVLVNNAGVNYTAAVEDLSMEDWRAQFETNVFGVLRVTRAVLPHMRARRSGRILMMSSLSGLMTPPTQGAYSSSKHALEGLSNALRMELYPFGIDVVLIEPVTSSPAYKRRPPSSQSRTWKEAGRMLRSMRNSSPASTQCAPSPSTHLKIARA